MTRLYRGRRMLLAAGLVGVIGACAYSVARGAWAGYQLRAAHAAMARGDHPQARTCLLACAAVWPTTPEIQILLARTARRAGDAAEAAARLERSRALGAIPEAIELEQNLGAVQGGLVAPHENVLWAYADRAHPDAVYILEALARGYLVTFRLSLAEQAAARWLEQQPDNPQAWLVRGKIAYHMHDWGAAQKHYAQAVALAPADVEARTLYANILSENARPAEALAQFDELLRLEPARSAARVGRARALLGLARGADARQALDEVPPGDSADAALALLRGQIDMQLAQFERAEPWLRQAAQASPFDREAAYSLAQCLQQQGKKEEAQQWLEQLKRIQEGQAKLSEITKKILASPQDADLRCQAGEIFLGIGDHRHALGWLESALREDPYHRPTHRLLAEHYHAQGRRDLAEHHERAAAK